MIIRLVNANLGKTDTIESDAETWGELQTEEAVQPFLSGNVQAVVRETQNILGLDQAELPTEKLTDDSKEHDFTLFFITKKSKAGDKYSDMSFGQLRSACASRDGIEGNSGNYGTSEEMRDLLRADDARSTPDECCSDDSSVREILERIEAKIDALSCGDNVTYPSNEDEEDGPTQAEIEEANLIASNI